MLRESESIVLSANSCSEAEPPRRGFLRTVFGSLLGWAVAVLGAVAGLWSFAAARFMVPNVINEPALRFKVGRLADYPTGYVETRYKEEYGVWVVSGVYCGRREIFALSTRCTHLGCITVWQASEEVFKCPCHGSGFLKDGVNFEGPAPRPLERYAIRVAEDGQLEIDRSRVFRQELGQWSDPDCFVES